MRRWGIFLLAAGLAAQESAPNGAVRGTLLEWDPSASGDLSVRVKDNHVYCFQFDPKTSVERDDQRIRIPELRKGDVVEIVPGPGPRSGLRYARSVRVLVSRPVLPVVRYPVRRLPSYNPVNDLFPRGSLTFAGIVTQLTPETLMLRTRAHGDTRIRLRPDTRYVQDGLQVGASVLHVNARIFVRGNRNLDDEIEAYQVMWGKILNPRD